MPANLENSAVLQDWKRSVFILVPKKGNAKECSNYHTIALISHTSKVMLKILQTRLQQYVNCELPDVQAGFRKGRGTRDQMTNICWIIEKTREFQKTIYFCFIDYAKAFDCVDHNKLENSERNGIIIKFCASLNMPVNLENSAVATELEKVSFHSNPEERQ